MIDRRGPTADVAAPHREACAKSGLISESALAVAGAVPTKSGVDRRGVGDIERAAVEADQTPLIEPSALLCHGLVAAGPATAYRCSHATSVARRTTPLA